MTAYVLDTNTIAAILRNDPSALERFDAVALPTHTVLVCPMVWYEVRRGLLAKRADKQMRLFDDLVATFEWQDYTPQDWSLAASLRAQRRGQGKPIQDADLLIAVFALNRQAILVTDNEKDFVDLGLTTENWVRRDP
jgi:tRNA(fMet)-specific endonuclease VapC